MLILGIFPTVLSENIYEFVLVFLCVMSFFYKVLTDHAIR